MTTRVAHTPEGVSAPRGRATRLAWIAALAVTGGGGQLLIAPATAAPPRCELRLAVKLTPDVENPRDPSFLSGLLGNNAGYSLIYQRRRDDDARVVLDLTGPGPDYLCDGVVESIRRSGFVLAIDVLPRTS
jgi:hypothetical protein